MYYQNFNWHRPQNPMMRVPQGFRPPNQNQQRSLGRLSNLFRVPQSPVYNEGDGPSSSGTGIGGPVGGFMGMSPGTIGTGLGMATGIPGLGTIGSLMGAQNNQQAVNSFLGAVLGMTPIGPAFGIGNLASKAFFGKPLFDLIAGFANPDSGLGNSVSDLGGELGNLSSYGGEMMGLGDPNADTVGMDADTGFGGNGFGGGMGDVGGIGADGGNMGSDSTDGEGDDGDGAW